MDLKGIVFFCFFGCFMFVHSQKMHGLSFVGTRADIQLSQVKKIQDVNANWVTLMPFGYLYSLQDSLVKFNRTGQWKGETAKGINETIPLFHQAGIKVMLKPQLWIRNGAFTGKIDLKSKREWASFKRSYSTFILHFAALAEEHRLPLFCIGTELTSVVENDPDYWRDLIISIRQIYSGKLTYAENWDSYTKVDFWDQLDFIGVNAYFPLKGKESLSVSVLKKRWIPTVTVLTQLSDSLKRPVVFTEMGYRSIDDPVSRPWDYRQKDVHFNPVAQAIALEALFETFQPKSWWAGGFVWKWFPQHSTAGGNGHKGFTPQNKMAETVLQSYFTKAE